MKVRDNLSFVLMLIMCSTQKRTELIKICFQTSAANHMHSSRCLVVSKLQIILNHSLDCLLQGRKESTAKRLRPIAKIKE